MTPLIDESFAARLTAAGLPVVTAKPDYVRNKPPASAIVAYRFGLDDGTWTRGYAQFCGDVDRVDRIHHKAVRFRPTETDLGHGVFRLDPHTVVYGFPTDARLRRLRWYTTPRKLKRSLAPLVPRMKRASRIEVLRYKPERRMVARVDAATGDGPVPLLIRYSTDARGHRLARVAGALRSAGVDCPEPLGVLEDGRVSVDRFVGGRQLVDVVRTGRGDPCWLAHCLLRFHTATPPGGVGLRTPADDLWRVHSGLRGLATRCPDLAGTARSIGLLLGRRVPLGLPAGRYGFIHGDLHAKNVLVDDTRLWFVDLERVAVGPIAVDLGTLLAHALAGEVRRPGWSPNAVWFARSVVEAVRAAGPGPGGNGMVEERELAWYTAVGLVDQAVLVSRHFEGEWIDTSHRLLDLAHRVLEGGHNGSNG